MPRHERKRSKSGIYHVMLRGINRQILFEDDEDKQKFFEKIKQYKEKSGYKILGYCLMDNHVHLLIQEGKEVLEVAMKRIGVSYVYWYNLKYKRSGHLFQDRYKSEPVEDDGYLLMVLKYIHLNPLKAGLVSQVGDYSWSSYHEYKGNPMIVDSDFVLGMFCNDQQRLMHYLAEDTEVSEGSILDVTESSKLLNEDVKQIIEKAIGNMSLSELRNAEKSRRNEILKKLKQENQLSIRQIARITGLTVNIVARA
ncbi:REP element-mobilizing transposase RayT [Anaerospora hongkongensis]|uniref:REP element-mobilizing transposase RayT n=1 Tax=Anaerospora hongkongensis TaxID=244830 RepID=A0A4R1PZA9_9FIRM|nr:transposase [Anaerospora hongkongensis]TCL38304.1 REP element-mobilizing transposase RayT [Anaerospora hongkongensis]